MTPPTIEQRVQAQAAAGYGLHPEVLAREMPNLMSPDELRAVLVELEELRELKATCGKLIVSAYLDKLEQAERQRDQWRECAIVLEASLHDGRHNFDDSAQKRFDALVKEEKQ